jgi:tetratricopeptide (TPR) repeat protein
MSKQALKYKERGNAEFKKGNHGKAIEYYTYATELDPSNHIFFTNRATAYFKMGVYKKSLRDANKAIKLNSGWWKGHMKKAESLFALGEFKDAREAAQEGIKASPPERAGHFEDFIRKAKAQMMNGMSAAELAKMEGNDFYKQSKLPEAIKCYTSAIGLCGRDETELLCSLYANRAACNRQLRNDDAVIADCTKALKINPKYAKVLLRRAQSYETIEKYREACDDFQKAAGYATGPAMRNQALGGASRCRKHVKQLEKTRD